MKEGDGQGRTRRMSAYAGEPALQVVCLVSALMLCGANLLWTIMLH